MNKQELQKKYQDIVLKTNGGNDDYVVALCQIANAINELDEPKQDTKWQKLKEWVSFTQPKNINDEFIDGVCSAYSNIIDKMQELEVEDE